MSRTGLRFSKLALVGLSLWRPSHHDLLYKSQQLPLPSFTVFIRPEVCEGLERETGDSSRKRDILGAAVSVDGYLGHCWWLATVGSSTLPHH